MISKEDIYSIIKKEVSDTSVEFGYDRNESHFQDKYVGYQASLRLGNLDHLTDESREDLILKITKNIFDQLIMKGVF